MGSFTGIGARLPNGEVLSNREVEVLRLMAEGKLNKEIGPALHISEETIKRHVRNILLKTGTWNRAHAVAVGFRLGIIE